MANTPLVVERIYNAPANTVWEALTDNNKLKQWYFQLEEFRPEIGFVFTFMGGDKTTQYKHICEVTQVVPGKKLAYTWRYDGYPGNSEVSFELFPEGDKTRLKLTHTGLETFAADKDKNFRVESFNNGWTFILGTNLANFLEGKK
ncbi:SRPBCC domain-containing protein [Chitinophaga parva]|uniref:SRPBCC domain-containing protein n=1 Tax=Chitinophaga parva TaxID=2169414 RepID=A0A2T7BD39_9BACT|nr:SRPBCC domain-containing protein [Chitinophaga parva]PUZ22940.1 SRPBCC domain-containing protein [Chitinophaga parva]